MDKFQGMALKKQHIKYKKQASDSYNSIVAEAAAAYDLPSLTPVYGTMQVSNYIKRSLVLMGVANTSPFNTVENVADFIDCIREGVPKKALDNLAATIGVSTLEIAGIMRTSDRTLRRYTPKQKLNAEQSERVIELAKIYSRGEEVFGSLDAFKEWMNSTVMALGNKKPKEFLDTSMGIEMLMDELGRIEHGIFA